MIRGGHPYLSRITMTSGVPLEPESAATPAGLLTLMELREDTRQVWDAAELSAVLRHQLDAPLGQALGACSAEAGHEVEKLRAHGRQIRSLAELFDDSQPPIELLALTKRCAKQWTSNPDSPLPREINIFMYYVSIAAGRRRGAKDISGLSSAAVKDGLQWCLSQKWIEGRPRRLLEELLGDPA